MNLDTSGLLSLNQFNHERLSQLRLLGVLRPEEGLDFYKYTEYPVHPELQEWVEGYWSASWDLGSFSFQQSVLFKGNPFLTFEDDAYRHSRGQVVTLTGPSPGRYIRTLTGSGRIFVVRFHPAMLKSWTRNAVNAITGRTLVLEEGSYWIVSALKSLPDIMHTPLQLWSTIVDQILLKYRPEPDSIANELKTISQMARFNCKLWSPEALAKVRGVSLRTNQRDFLRYLGFTPRWLGTRYRINYALDILDRVRWKEILIPNLTVLALELGYFDQAHFTHEFKALTGVTPGRYLVQSKSNFVPLAC